MLSLIDRSDDRCVGPHAADGITSAMKNYCIIVLISRGCTTGVIEAETEQKMAGKEGLTRGG